MIEPRVVVGSLHEDARRVEGIGALCRFWRQFYSCWDGRADAVFELADALLCSEGPVRSLVGLALAPKHRRGHGALDDGLHRGVIDVARLRRTLAGLALPRIGGQIGLAVAVAPWLRPDAPCPQRLFCYVHGRAKKATQMIPGGRTRWTAVVDAVRLGPADDATAVTAGQLREVVQRLRQAGHWHPGEADI